MDQTHDSGAAGAYAQPSTPRPPSPAPHAPADHARAGRGHAGAVFPPPPPTVEEAKLRLLEWGVAADEDVTAMVAEVRDGFHSKVRSAAPWAAGLAGLYGLVTGLKGGGGRRSERGGTAGGKAARAAGRGVLGLVITAMGVARAAIPIVRTVMAYRGAAR